MYKYPHRQVTSIADCLQLQSDAPLTSRIHHKTSTDMTDFSKRHRHHPAAVSTMSGLTWLLLGCFLLKDASGSAISFNSSTKFIKPVVTKELTMTCALYNTEDDGNDAETRSTGDVLKRSIGGDVLIDNERQTRLAESFTNEKTKRAKTVTETAEDISSVFSIAIYRGEDVVASIAFQSSGAKSFIPEATVSGELTNGEGELSMTWSNPTQDVAHDYKCEINTVNGQGQTLMFGQTLRIEKSHVSMGDLMEEISEMKKTIGEQTRDMEEISEMKKTIGDQTRDMMEEISEMKKTIGEQTRELNKLQRLIFFTAQLSSSKSFSTGEVVVWDRIISNEGGAYDRRTGIFTCPSSGFYHFEVHVWSGNNGDFWFDFKINNNKIFTLNSHNAGYLYVRGVSNSAFVRLQVGDKVKVTSRRNSHTYASSYYIDSSFSGRKVTP